MAEVQVEGHGPALVQMSLLWTGRAILLVLLLLGTVANALALLAFYRGPGLRTLSNRFVMNMLVMNLVACASLLPLVVLDSTKPVGLNNYALCSVSEGITAGYCTASILGVLLIAVDQYFAVVDPLRYHSKVDAMCSVGMLAGAWMCAALFGGLGAVEPLGASAGAGMWTSCSLVPPLDTDNPLGAGSSTLFRRVYVVVFAVLVFLLPFLALCWIYVSIYGAAHRNSQRTRRNGSGSVIPATPPPELNCAECKTSPPTPSGTLTRKGPLPGGLPVSRSAPAMDVVASESDLLASRRSSVTSSLVEVQTSSPRSDRDRRRSSCPHAASVTVTVSPPPPVRSASACFVSSLRCRISNASLFRYREEGRAARVSALVVVMALGCWAPYVAMLVLHAFLPSVTHPHLDALSIAALSSAVLISPCLFAYRNRRVQKEVRCLLCPGNGKQSLERGKRRGGLPNGSASKVRSNGSGGSARRLLPPNYSHTALNLMASLAEDSGTGTPSDSTSALTISTGKSVDDTSALTVTVSLLPPSTRCPNLPDAVPPSVGLRDRLQALVWVPRKMTPAPIVVSCRLPEEALSVDTARSSFSSGVSSSQGSAVSTDTIDE